VRGESPYHIFTKLINALIRIFIVNNIKG